MLKKSVVKLASIGLLLLAFLTPGQVQAKAKTVTPKMTNAVLKLNYKTYVYNKKGQRIRWFKGTKGWQTYYKKGAKIKTSRTVKRTTKDVRYYLLYNYDIHNDTNLKKYWLPYKKIKGNYFYSIGHGYYIKARNVYSVNAATQYSNGEKVRAENFGLAYILTIVSRKVKKNNKTIIKSSITTRKHIKDGTVLTVDGIYHIRTEHADDMDMPLFKIKGTKNKYISDQWVKSKDSQVFLFDAESSTSSPRVSLPRFFYIY